MSSARPAAAARRGTSRRGRSSSTTTWPATGDVLLDKQYMTVDATKGSPFQDRIYVTWTLFDADGTSYIYGAFSRDYGEHFSSAEAREPRQRAVLEPDSGVPTPQGRCNTNQFSQPFTGPDGALYVVWDNYNLTGVRPGEGEGGEGGDDDLGATPRRRDRQPRADAAREVDRRRQLVLGAGEGVGLLRPARLPDLPGRGPGPRLRAREGRDLTTRSSGPRTTRPARSTRRTRREVVVTLGSYINRHSNESNGCVPQGFNPDTFQALYDGVKTPGACNNDIVISRSTNGGADVHRRQRRTYASCRRPARRDHRAPTSSGSGRRSTRAAAWPSRTTTATTATTRRPDSRTSACPGRATAATSPRRV